MPRRNQLVDTLLERIRPVVERFAQDLAVIAAARIERDLGRLGEAVEVALSTYASDRPDLIMAAFGPELAAMLTPPKETHADPDRGDHDPVPHVRRTSGRGLPGLEPQRPDDTSEAPAQAPPPRREEGERAARLVDASSVRKPVRKPNTCSKCGYVGGTAYGCGRSHPTRGVDDLDVP
jgi:hypothetical protein